MHTIVFITTIKMVHSVTQYTDVIKAFFKFKIPHCFAVDAEMYYIYGHKKRTAVPVLLC